MRAAFLLPYLLCSGPAPAATGPGSSLQAQPAAMVIRLDGRLEEAAWARAPVATEFTQEWPQRGVPALQRTEVRVLYDARFLYVGARMHHDRVLDHGEATVVQRLHRRDQRCAVSAAVRSAATAGDTR